MTSARVRTRLSLLLILFVVGGVVAVVGLPELPKPANGSTVFSADTEVYGATLGEWNARHWQWTLSQPIGTNPGQDATGAHCGNDQTGPVFFLPRNFPPCQVPANRLLFIPIVGTECSTVEPFPYFGSNEHDLRSCAERDIDRYTNITVRIDGAAIVEITAYRATTPLFSMTLPENNVLGVAPGAAELVADGYQMLTAPLTPGIHEIMVHLELIDGTVLPDKVMRLTVVDTGAL